MPLCSILDQQERSELVPRWEPALKAPTYGTSCFALLPALPCRNGDGLKNVHSNPPARSTSTSLSPRATSTRATSSGPLLILGAGWKGRSRRFRRDPRNYLQHGYGRDRPRRFDEPRAHHRIRAMDKGPHAGVEAVADDCGLAFSDPFVSALEAEADSRQSFWRSISAKPSFGTAGHLTRHAFAKAMQEGPR
jgi:hypothetical protein